MPKNIFDSVSTREALTSKDLDYFKAFNEAYKTDDFLPYSEAAPFDLKQIEKWLSIRKDFAYTENLDGSDWVAFPITTIKKKYGIYTIYLDYDRKLWRTTQTISEFGYYD